MQASCSTVYGSVFGRSRNSILSMHQKELLKTWLKLTKHVKLITKRYTGAAGETQLVVREAKTQEHSDPDSIFFFQGMHNKRGFPLTSVSVCLSICPSLSLTAG